jgi:hypothetical protein
MWSAALDSVGAVLAHPGVAQADFVLVVQPCLVERGAGGVEAASPAGHARFAAVGRQYQQRPPYLGPANVRVVVPLACLSGTWTRRQVGSRDKVSAVLAMLALLREAHARRSGVTRRC